MPSRTIEPGSLVTVAGGAGYIGSAIARTLLKQGYRVRATTRSIEGAQGVQSLFDTEYPGQFELVKVEDWTVKGAYDTALQGANGFIVVAADVTFAVDTETILHNSRTAVEHVLESAARAKSVRRVVITSSRVASYHPQEDDDYDVTEHTWNNAVIDAAKATPTEHEAKAILNYAAGKTAAEHAAWEWVEAHKPDFVLNVVLPDITIGEILTSNRNFTAAWLVQLFHGDEKAMIINFLENASWYVNVDDVARLHLAALVEPDVKSERLYAAAGPFTINDVFAIWRRHFPERQFPHDYKGSFAKATKIRVHSERSLELLRRYGQAEWTSLEQSLLDTLKNFA